MKWINRSAAKNSNPFPPWPLWHLSNYPENIGKTPKSSNPVLSAQKPWFPQGFAHFWPIALEFCSAHATRCMADRGVAFRVALPKSSRFSSRASRQSTGV
jgi:hypothetical protein